MNHLHPIQSGLIGIFILAIVSLFLANGCSDQSTEQKKSTASTALSEKKIIDLTTTTTLDFAHAVNAGDLSLFRDSTADEFKKNFSVQQFNSAFGGFIEQKINMLAVQNLAPVFNEPPKVSDAGILTVQGYFPTSPSRIRFNYSYKQDPVAWKIIGINIKVEPQT